MNLLIGDVRHLRAIKFQHGVTLWFQALHAAFTVGRHAGDTSRVV
jgi:hypothetical protein